VTKRRLGILIAVALVPLLAGAAIALYDVWQSATNYVTTKDAQVAAHIVQAQSAVAGQVGQYVVGVGDAVQEGDVVAWVSGPARLRVSVRAPLAGKVLSLPVPEGSAVAAGQALVTIGDLDHLWVVANVEEARAGQVRVGQPAEVRVEAAGVTLQGVVAEITPATQAALGATGGASSQARVAGSAARGPQAVPVRIALAAAPPPALFPGMTAEVRIAIR
jgi:multidrug resistance efflux pump